MRYSIYEGGNVFKTDDGGVATQRINRADVDPTLQWLEKITGVPHQDFKLGTTGIKDTSGDLDIAVNPKDKEIIHKKLIDYVTARGEDPKKWIKKAGVNIHFKTPISGDEKKGFVQTDLMFGDQEWMRWSMKGVGIDSPFKGKHRHLMMASIAKAKGLMWSFQKGLVDRNTREVMTQNPTEIAHHLLGPNSNPNDLDTVESMYKIVSKLPDADKLLADAVAAFEKEGLTLPKEDPQLESFLRLAGLR